jgi:hypothetical protein
MTTKLMFEIWDQKSLYIEDFFLLWQISRGMGSNGFIFFMEVSNDFYVTVYWKFLSIFFSRNNRKR